MTLPSASAKGPANTMRRWRADGGRNAEEISCWKDSVCQLRPPAPCWVVSRSYMSIRRASGSTFHVAAQRASRGKSAGEWINSWVTFIHDWEITKPKYDASHPYFAVIDRDWLCMNLASSSSTNGPAQEVKCRAIGVELLRSSFCIFQGRLTCETKFSFLFFSSCWSSSQTVFPHSTGSSPSARAACWCLCACCIRRYSAVVFDANLPVFCFFCFSAFLHFLHFAFCLFVAFSTKH